MDTEVEVVEDTSEVEVLLQIVLMMTMLEVLEGLLTWVHLYLDR
jgi:hypothetical protein